MEAALLVSAVGSSLSAAVVIGMARYVYRIDQRTTRNHETLHDTANGPGIKRKVEENRAALHRENMLDPPNPRDD